MKLRLRGCRRWIILLLMLAGIGCSLPAVLADELSGPYPGYPSVFDVEGTVDQVGPGRVIVNDCTFVIGPATTFHTPSGLSSSAMLSVGSRVGLLLDGKQRIHSLWLLARSGRTSPDRNPANGSGRNANIRATTRSH